jgi:hypothetical protein
MPSYSGIAPTLGDYLCWVHTQGCHTKSGVFQDKDGITSMIRIVNQTNDKQVTILSMSPEETLQWHQIANFDRRLGLKSDWFSSDDD